MQGPRENRRWLAAEVRADVDRAGRGVRCRGVDLRALDLRAARAALAHGGAAGGGGGNDEDDEDDPLHLCGGLFREWANTGRGDSEYLLTS